MHPWRAVQQGYVRFSLAYHPFLAPFHRKVAVQIDKGHYRIKTVENRQELQELLELRYEIFHREFQNKKNAIGTDVEALDGIGDHLVIIDKRTQKIVGTYRLVSSSFSHRFYSESEFKLQSFLQSPGEKLELSRAGVQKEYRTGVVMNLLWRGVAEYLQKVDAQYLFGCSSIRTTDASVAQNISRHFISLGSAETQFQVQPTLRYQMPDFSTVAPSVDTPTEWIPPLLNSYLRMGAKVAAVPALDRAFRCIDFLTILRVSELRRPYERRYRD